MTIIIIKLEAELVDTRWWHPIRRLLLASRIEDNYNARQVMSDVELLRGDMLYRNIPNDNVICHYAHSNSLIHTYEKVNFLKLHQKA
jgi:hypothetical protein